MLRNNKQLPIVWVEPEFSAHSQKVPMSLIWCQKNKDYGNSLKKRYLTHLPLCDEKNRIDGTKNNSGSLLFTLLQRLWRDCFLFCTSSYLNTSFGEWWEKKRNLYDVIGLSRLHWAALLKIIHQSNWRGIRWSYRLNISTLCTWIVCRPRTSGCCDTRLKYVRDIDSCEREQA